MADVHDPLPHPGIFGQYFHVLPDTEGKSIKTAASRRKFPIHPELVKMGFLDYIAGQMASGSTKVFPELPAGKNGYRSNRFSRWFNEGFLPKVGAKTEKTKFHSFRHNFRDALRDAVAPIEIVEALGGWTGKSSSGDRYGKGFTPDHLLKYVEQIKYPDLDLSHLYVKDN